MSHVVRREADLGKADFVVANLSVEVPDMVNHPPHYERGPKITFKVPNLPLEDGTPLPDMEITRTVQHIEIFRQVKDPRLATAFKYWWRVTFGGKGDDAEDIKKAIFYLTDYLEHPGD